MLVDVALTVEEVAEAPLGGASVAVVDVVRASTTIVTALAHGARAVIPVPTPEAALARAREWPAGQVLVGGEREGDPPEGFTHGNSPAEYTAQAVGGRAVVFTTTNGTRALLAVRGAGRIAVGGFVNARAVAEWLAGGSADALVVCAGRRGRFSLEDATCAGLIVSRLRTLRPDARVSDGARAAAVLYAHYAGDLGAMLREAAWARALQGKGHGGDLALCVAVDAHALVPVVRDGALVAAARD